MSQLLYVRTGNGGSDPAHLVKDLGKRVPTGAGWTLLSASSAAEGLGSLGEFSARDIRDSQDLFDAISGGTLEWSKDGSTQELAGDYRADYMLFEDFSDDDATFNDLTVSGLTTLDGLTVSGVDFGTLTDHLDGGPGKHDASEIDVEGTYANAPSSPTDLETVISELNTAIAGGTNSWATVVGDSGSASADAPGDTLNIVGANGILTTATDDPETVTVDGDNLLPRDGSRPMTGNLDMGSQDITNLFNLTASGLVDLSDGRFVLPQANDVTSAFPGGQEGELAWDIDDDTLYAHDGTQWFGLAPASGIITDHGGLTGLGDDDHPNVPWIPGDRTRNTISGVFDFRTGDILLPTESTGQDPLADGNAAVEGAAAVIGGQLALYDGTRSKWLGTEKVYSAGKEGNAKTVYLSGADGVAHSAAGIVIPRDATIVAATVKSNTVGTYTITLERNGGGVSIGTLLSVTASDAGSATNLDIDVDADDELQIFFSSGTTIKDIQVQLHLRDRL